MTKIFIPGCVPSLKNSKIYTGKYLVSSPAVKKYLNALGIQSYSASRKEVKGYVKRPNEFAKFASAFAEMLKGKSKPYKIGFYFVRDSKRSWDYVNMVQLPLDLMVAHGWIKDDNVDEVVPIFKGYMVDKSQPGVYIEVL